MPQKIPLMRFLFIGGAACFVLCTRCFGAPAIVQTAAVPHISTMPGSIHIKYSTTLNTPPAPKAFLDRHIAELDEKIKQAEESPGGKGSAHMNNQAKAVWQRRRVASPPEHGQAEYWGTKSGMIWSNGQTAYAYNGVYNTTAHPGDLFPSLFESKASPEWLHVVPDTDGLELVPYLGFFQPGKEMFSPGRPMARKTSTGFEERRDVKDKIHGSSFTLVAQYDTSGRLVSITKLFGDIVVETSQFSNYTCIGQNLCYPKTIETTSYVLYPDHGKIHTFIDKVAVYKVQSADNKPIDASLFDANYPRVGVVVQDSRYKSKSRPYGVQYEYTDNKLTVAQASAIAARQPIAQEEKAGSEISWLVMAIRLICLAVVFLLIGRAVLALIRKGSAQE